MQKYTFTHRGNTINKIRFSEIEGRLEHKGFYVDKCFELMADEHEVIYVSNGFLRGLSEENEQDEWHHYFKKDASGNFDAFKMPFNNQHVIHSK